MICKCERNFTCGYCLRDAKPYVWTGDHGTFTVTMPVMGVMATVLNHGEKLSKERCDALRRSPDR
jgi:hypothetical protein